MTTPTNNMHFLEAFEPKVIHRSQIKEAAYNPRSIEKQNSTDLGQSLKKNKLREPLVWNEQTGNLVGGHQRLGKLDEAWFKKYKNYDYSLTLAVVNITLKEEIELNIALNNPRLMGDYDIQKMNDLLSSDLFPKIDFDAAGIKDEDLQMFGINMDLQNLENIHVDEMISEFEQVKEQRKAEVSPEERAERKADVKAAKGNTVKNEVDTFVTITFSNQADKRAFMAKIGENEANLYIKGEVFVSKYFPE